MAKIIICKDCGEEKEHASHGLCDKCYMRWYYKNNPDKREEALKRAREHYRDNLEEARKYSREYSREWRKANPGRARQLHLRHRYNIDLEEYNLILESQDGCCAICGMTPEEHGKSLFVDHNHETGEVRGLLCNHCNLSLGYLKEDPRLFIRAVEYLLGSRT